MRFSSICSFKQCSNWLGRPLLDEHCPLYDGLIGSDEHKTFLSEVGDIPLTINVVTSEDPIICARKCLRLVRE